MLTGDDLTIQLFIGASAIAVLGVAVTQAGWTHKWFAWSLFVIAATLALFAVFWKPIRDAHPAIGPVASEVAGNSISWFTLLLVGFGIVLLLDLLARIRWWAPSQHRVIGEEHRNIDKPGSKTIEPPKERVFVTIHPEHLMAFYDDRTSVQGDQLAQNYIGKWMKVSGAIGNASVKGRSILAVIGLQNMRHIMLMFDEKWRERVSLMISGQKIAVIGEIREIGDANVILHHCELID